MCIRDRIKTLLAQQNEVLFSLVENFKSSVDKLGLVPRKTKCEITEVCKEFVSLHSKELQQVQSRIRVIENEQTLCDNKLKYIATIIDERRYFLRLTLRRDSGAELRGGNQEAGEVSGNEDEVMQRYYFSALKFI
eukprot:TRINITY_DN7771_c0_g1_i12.p1 TRINITY_DN7771_c0_g1~~TRINITY_DN7771_c0_g1_i12.p1  ORF type:complete len:135 (-),score=24.29 TRINITY_DN7771_c0_g1_i12:819-1223(-)